MVRARCPASLGCPTLGPCVADLSLLEFLVKNLSQSDLPGCSDGKESACNAGDMGSVPGSGRWEWLPIPVLLPGEFYGQRSLEGYKPWSCKELDMTDQLFFFFFFPLRQFQS